MQIAYQPANKLHSPASSNQIILSLRILCSLVIFCVLYMIWICIPHVKTWLFSYQTGYSASLCDVLWPIKRSGLMIIKNSLYINSDYFYSYRDLAGDRDVLAGSWRWGMWVDVVSFIFDNIITLYRNMIYLLFGSMRCGLILFAGGFGGIESVLGM